MSGLQAFEFFDEAALKYGFGDGKSTLYKYVKCINKTWLTRPFVITYQFVFIFIYLSIHIHLERDKDHVFKQNKRSCINTLIKGIMYSF